MRRETADADLGLSSVVYIVADCRENSLEDDNSLVGGGGQVYIVHPCAGAANDTEWLGGRDNLGRDLRIGAHYQPVVFL